MTFHWPNRLVDGTGLSWCQVILSQVAANSVPDAGTGCHVEPIARAKLPASLPSSTRGSSLVNVKLW